MTPLCEKIARIIPRLGSSHDGEVVACVRAIERALSADGLDWHDLAESVSGGRPIALPAHERHEPRTATPPRWTQLTPAQRQAWLERLLRSPMVSPWECEFVSSIRRYARSEFLGSPKQRVILDELVARDHLDGRAAA